MQVAIIGGGLMGTASAFFLLSHPNAPKSLKVTLIERGAVGAGATVASFGNVRRQGRDFRQMALAHHSLSLWGRLEGLLDCDVEFRPTGHIRAVFHDDALQDMQAFAKAASYHGLDIELLDRAALRTRFPFLSHKAIAGSFSPQDGSGNPRLVAPAFARAAVRLGLNILDHTPVSAVHANDTRYQVVTPNTVIDADLVLNCAGAWGKEFAKAFGEPVPLMPYAPQMGVTEPLAHRIFPVVGVWARTTQEVIYCRQVERWNIVFGGGAREDVALDPGYGTVNPIRTLHQIETLAKLIPALRGTSVIRTWSGCEGYLDDMLPIIGPSARHDGVFHAFGFCGHGFQLGPGVGSELAELMLTGESRTNLRPFHIERFQKQVASRF